MKMFRKKRANGLIRVVSTFFFIVLVLPAGVYADITPPVSDGSAVILEKEAIKGALPSSGNITVNFKNVDIKTVLHYLSEVSGVDIVSTDKVIGEVTMRLRNKPWEVALDVLTRNLDYTYSLDDDQGIIRVMSKSEVQSESLVTEVIPLNHLVREIELTRESSEQEVEAVRKEESILQLMSAINSILDRKRGEGATFITSVNSIIVTAIPANISSIRKMVAKIDKRTPQIMLDAKVIEITLSDEQRFGIDWNAVISASGSKRPTTFPFTNDGIFQNLPGSQRKFFPTLTPGMDDASFPLIDAAVAASPFAAPVAGAMFAYGTLDFSQFRATLSMINDKMDSEILSSPRITTLDNQKATIKVVEKMMLQKTVETTQTATLVTVEYEKEDQAREVGFKLTVIPHVNEHGEISVNLLPEVSTKGGTDGSGFQEITVGVGLNTVALIFNSREANTMVRVRDGETIFIGGLIRKDERIRENKLPILGDIFGGIPIVGNIFKYEENIVTRSEIVFFVTVHLIKDGMDSIEKSGSMVAYNKYSPVGEDPKKEGDSVIKTGQLNLVQKKEEIKVVVSEEKKKKRKWFFFF